MPEIGDLPREVLLQIFPHCPLKSLIAAVGVCTLWRTIIPHSDIDKTRRGLLNLYFTIIESPVFVRSRPWLLENLHPFDRQGYIDALLDQHDYLPNDFRLWILEWPAKAVIACMWPGLPYKCWGYSETDGIERIHGCNFLGRIPPILHTVEVNRIGSLEEGNVKTDVPALLVWENDNKIWLVLAQRPLCSYSVYTLPDDILLDAYHHLGSGEHREELESDEGSTSDDDSGEFLVCSSWTEWLRCLFEGTESSAEIAQEAEENGTADRRANLPGPRIDGKLVTQDEWFRAQPQTERVWADSHDTGRMRTT